jgi:hypothetical protein
MIKANELRLGNRLNLDDLDIDTGKWHERIIEVTYRDIHNLLHGHNMVKEAYNPIPLTEEILLKCGFDYDEEEKDYCITNNLGHKYGVHISNKNCALILYSITDWQIASNFKYLHQLQNLYFALTGEELEVNL